MAEPRVADNPPELRYEIWVDGQLAGEIRYTLDGEVVTMVHTEIDPAREGAGLGQALVAGALDDVRGQGRRVRPICPFVAKYIARHPEHADLVA
jgi:predicted GNAT family acetyltransferase